MIAQRNWEPSLLGCCLLSHFCDFVQSCAFAHSLSCSISLDLYYFMMTIILFFEFHCYISATSFYVSTLQLLLAHLLTILHLLNDHSLMLGHSLFVFRIQWILGIFAWRSYLKIIRSWDYRKSSPRGSFLDWRARFQTLIFFHWFFWYDGWMLIENCYRKYFGLKGLAIDFLKNHWTKLWWITAYHVSGKLMLVSFSWESCIDIKNCVCLSRLCNSWS
jgi:hypothetical protein